MGNAQIKTARGQTRKEQVRYTMRHLKQSESTAWGDKIIAYVDNLTKSPVFHLEQYNEIAEQLTDYVNNVVQFIKDSWTLQDWTPALSDIFFNQEDFELNRVRSDTTPLSASQKADFLRRYVQSLWTLLQSNNGIMFHALDYDVVGTNGLGFLRGYSEKEFVDKIKAELSLRYTVFEGVKELVHSCHSSGKFDASNWEKVKHKLTIGMQETLTAITKEVPYFPLLLTCSIPQGDSQHTVISEDDENVKTMMVVFADTVYTRDSGYFDGEDLAIIDKFLIKLVMRDYHKHKEKTIEYPRERIAIRLKEEDEWLPPGTLGEVYKDEYSSSKTSGNPLAFQSDITFLPIEFVEHILPAQKLPNYEVITDTDKLEKIVENKLIKTWSWLDEEAQKPDGGLFDNEEMADIFYRILFNIETVDKTKFLIGIPLFLLQRFLRSSESIRDRFGQTTAQLNPHLLGTNKKLACDLFCRSVNSLMTFGSLRAYFHVLKQWFTEPDLNKMRKKLKTREEVENSFVAYFFQPCQEFLFSGSPHRVNPVSASDFPDLLNQMNKFPYVFFLAFINRYQIVTRERHEEKNQLHVLRLFYDALHSSPDSNDQARRIFRSETTDCDGFTFKQKLYSALTENYAYSGNATFELHDLFHKAWEEIVLQKFLEKSKLKTYQWKELDQTPSSSVSIKGGAQGDTTLVYVPGIAVELVAKCFLDKSQYREISGEIECLLGNQFNPHIVQVYGCILDERQFFGILMEYCEGGSLHDFIQDETNDYTEKDIVRWTFHASSGLLYLHENKIVHKDVKPKNMLLAHKKLKICDLGISKMTSVSKDGMDKSTFVTNYFRGTPGYQAPELAAGKDSLTESVDVFSLGRSVWQMVFRVVPTPILPHLPVKVTMSDNLSFFVDMMMFNMANNRPAMNKVFKTFRDWHRGPPPEK